MPRVWLKTKGPLPKLKGRVLLEAKSKLYYIVTAIETPTHLDDDVSITECEIQPAGPEGVPVIAKLVMKKGEWT